jgi:hypothetical protein
MRGTQIMQVRIPWDDYAFGLLDLHRCAAPQHLPNQAATGRWIRGRQVCFESCVLKKEPRRARNGNAMQRVRWLRLALIVHHPARFWIQLVNPIQLVRVSQRVLTEHKWPREGVGPRLRPRATAKQNQTQQSQHR